MVAYRSKIERKLRMPSRIAVCAALATIPMSPVSPKDSGSDDAACSDALTTLDMNECYGQALARAENRKGEYLAAALARNSDSEDLRDMIRSADKAFEAYREAECDAVFERWKDGTIRGVMTLSCNIALIDQRTHQIWETWLTYPDGTPPNLPEPKPGL